MTDTPIFTLKLDHTGSIGIYKLTLLLSKRILRFINGHSFSQQT